MSPLNLHCPLLSRSILTRGNRNPQQPGMGVNAYFAYTVVGYRGTGMITYQQALAAVFIEGGRARQAWARRPWGRARGAGSGHRGQGAAGRGSLAPKLFSRNAATGGACPAVCVGPPPLY